jgi:predicted MPP superfamily phosphohydrolase
MRVDPPLLTRRRCLALVAAAVCPSPAEAKPKSVGGIQVLHLTDLHIGKGFDGKTQGASSLGIPIEQLIQRVNKAFPLSDTHSVIACTGDLVDQCLQEDGGNWQLGWAKELLGPWIKTGRFLICPGNHDFYGAKGGTERHLSTEARSEFYRTFLPDREIGAPWIQRVGNTVFVSVDSFAGIYSPEPQNRKGLHGALGKKQIEQLDKLLGSYSVQSATHRVLLMHNPLNARGSIFNKISRMGITERKTVTQLCNKHQVSLVLTGHTHQPETTEGDSDFPLECNGGTSSRSPSKLGKPGKGPLRTIDLSGQTPVIQPLLEVIQI